MNNKITGTFEPIPGTRGAYTLVVDAESFVFGARHVLARVGRQPVQSILPSPGGGFTARIDKPPNEGDRLYLQYVGNTSELATDVVFRSSEKKPVA